MERSTFNHLLHPVAMFITTSFPAIYYLCFFTGCLVHVLVALLSGEAFVPVNTQATPAASNRSHLRFPYCPLSLFPASSHLTPTLISLSDQIACSASHPDQFLLFKAHTHARHKHHCQISLLFTYAVRVWGFSLFLF